MDKLVDIVDRAFGAQLSDNEAHLSFKELDGWDSMNHMIFISELEKAFSIELSAEEIVAIDSLSSANKIINLKAAAHS